MQAHLLNTIYSFRMPASAQLSGEHTEQQNVRCIRLAIKQDQSLPAPGYSFSHKRTSCLDRPVIIWFGMSSFRSCLRCLTYYVWGVLLRFLFGLTCCDMVWEELFSFLLGLSDIYSVTCFGSLFVLFFVSYCKKSALLCYLAISQLLFGNEAKQSPPVLSNLATILIF